ncbi:MAG TPA: hypothetical protein PKW51_09075 [Methanoregulaceae archaeon]|nr:hypothetical protein [Methanoregulaceae archaeon]
MTGGTHPGLASPHAHPVSLVDGIPMRSGVRRTVSDSNTACSGRAW